LNTRRCASPPTVFFRADTVCYPISRRSVILARRNFVNKASQRQNRFNFGGAEGESSKIPRAKERGKRGRRIFRGPRPTPTLLFNQSILMGVTMKLNISASAILIAALLPLTACADLPGDHPGYLHALTDLRDARWNLEHRAGDAAVSDREDVAIVEIDRAIGEVKKAAREDDKNLGNHPPEDARLNHAGRLHHAVELLEKAHNDLAREEDNPEARELKHRALDHVDRALEAAKQAVHAAANSL
jgi:hypothetical protein